MDSSVSGTAGVMKPPTIDSRKKSPLMYTLRSMPPATSRPTVDFPDPGNPVIKIRRASAKARSRSRRVDQFLEFDNPRCCLVDEF